MDLRGEVGRARDRADLRRCRQPPAPLRTGGRIDLYWRGDVLAEGAYDAGPRAGGVRRGALRGRAFVMSGRGFVGSTIAPTNGCVERGRGSCWHLLRLGTLHPGVGRGSVPFDDRARTCRELHRRHRRQRFDDLHQPTVAPGGVGRGRGTKPPHPDDRGPAIAENDTRPASPSAWSTGCSTGTVTSCGCTTRQDVRDDRGRDGYLRPQAGRGERRLPRLSRRVDGPKPVDVRRAARARSPGLAAIDDFHSLGRRPTRSCAWSPIDSAKHHVRPTWSRAGAATSSSCASPTSSATPADGGRGRASRGRRPGRDGRADHVHGTEPDPSVSMGIPACSRRMPTTPTVAAQRRGRDVRIEEERSGRVRRLVERRLRLCEASVRHAVAQGGAALDPALPP